MATHDPDRLDEVFLEFFSLKNLLKAEIKEDILVGHFERRRKP
jgi:hypothetical protein